MNASNRIENAKLEKVKGEGAWQEATILFEKERFDGAVSRVYYAAYHFACAVLLTKGLEARSHQGLQRLFHLHFIRTGIFPQEVGVLLSHAQKAREEADYYPEVSFNRKVARNRMKDVEEFARAARQYLEKQGV